MLKNEMIRRLTVAVAMCAAALWSFADGSVTVKSVEAQQRYPWNGLVNIAVTMEGSADDVADAECVFAAKDFSTLSVAHVTQNGSDTGSGTTWTRRFIWDAAADVGAVKIDDLVLAVNAIVPDGVRLWENGPYWAECNLGATKPEEYGYYFWWGDMVGYKRNADNNGWVSVKDGSGFSFSEGNCPTYGKDNSALQSAGYIDSTGNLVAAHDAATAHLGAPWRMPTDAEFSALINNCDTQWTTRGGVYGRLVKGRGAYASKGIFLPAAGYGRDSYLKYAGSSGDYWSSTPDSYDSYGAWYLDFYSGNFYRCFFNRCCGLSVRPVRGFANGSTVSAQTGVAAHLKLDCRTGVRTCSADGEILRYDASWYENGDEVRITDNGTVVVTGTAGSYTWQPESGSSQQHILKLEVLSGGQVVCAEAAEFKCPLRITGVTAQQRYPWNGLVDIVVSLEGAADDIAEAECLFVATNTATGAAVPVASITRKGADTGSGTTWTRRYIWNAANDVVAIKIDNLALTVDAKVFGSVQLWENGPYWAECNVGALRPEEYGYYFWWGDTVGYKRVAANKGVSVKDGTAFAFTEQNCPTYGKSNSQLQLAGYIDSSGNLVAAHDAATAHLGAPWRMPTFAEIGELENNCDTTWTQRNGVSSRLVTGRGAYSSKSIFLPAAGSVGNYWFSTSHSASSYSAWGLNFDSGWFYRTSSARYYGRPVRPVRGFAMSGTAASGDGVTTYLKLDCRTGVRTCSGDGEVLRYDTSWYENGEEVRITDNGTVIAVGTVGSYNWHPELGSSRSHVLKLEVLSAGQVIGVETVKFVMPNVTSCAFNVMAEPVSPWGKVFLQYDITGELPDEAGRYQIFVAASNRTTGVVAKAESLTGDIAFTLGTHKLIWDLAADGLDFGGQSMDFIVSYSPLYIEIDLSGVVAGSCYPVSSLCDAPTNGWTDEHKTTKLVLRRIEARTCVKNDGGGMTLEMPIYMGVFEVTQRQWELVMGTRPSYFSNDASYAARPVEMVSYSMVFGEFLGILRAKTGVELDLPTWAQWEYACRAGTATDYNNGTYNTGTTCSNMNQVGRYLYNGGSSQSVSCDTSAGTAKVGSYVPNAWGLYDMHGNVEEWCVDGYGSSGLLRVPRGGSWNCAAERCTSQSMNVACGQGLADSDIGFRLICTMADNGEIYAGRSDAILFPVSDAKCFPMSLSYSPSGTEEAIVCINGGVSDLGLKGVVARDSKAGSFIWQPEHGGNYILSHLIHQKDLPQPVWTSWNTNIFVQCRLVGNGDHLHNVTKGAVEPTCTMDGSTREVICSWCGDVIEASSVVPKLGHEWRETKPAVAAGCTTDGCTHEVACSRCHVVLEASSVLPALGHAEVVTTVAKYPNCTEDGCTKGSYCSRCNAVLATSQAIAALGHVEVVTTAAREPNCTVAGCTKGSYCSRCNAVLTTSQAIAALGHVEVVTTVAKEPKCLESGCTKDSYCSRCNAILATSSVLPALGHVEVVTTVAKDPNCTEDGCTKGSKCSRCNAILSTSETIAALGHSGAVTKAAVEPTSGAAGATAEIRCSRCGELMQAAEVIPALGYIRNVTARQLWPHKKVAIDYVVADDIGDVADAGTALVLTGKYGSTTKTASHKVGAMSCVPGSHCIVWDFEGDSIAVNQSSMTFTVKYGSVSGTSSGVAINTSPTVKNGMSVEKTMALAYSPIDTGACEIEIDGTVALSSTNGGTFVWQPLTKGAHTLKHIAGGNVWTRTVNVTSLVFEEPTPSPSEEEDQDISLGATEKSVAAKGQTLTVATSGSGTWSASASVDWITIPEAYKSRNAGIPTMFSVGENKGVEPRTGFVYVSGHVITITQAGVGATLDSASADFETNGGTGTFTVLAGVENTWRAQANVDWISVSPTSGTGEGVVTFTVAPYNAVTTRSGTITAAGQTFTVNQTGRRLSVSPTALSVDWQSHVEPIAVEGLVSTTWGVGVDSTWLSIVNAGPGKAGGTVSIGINENPSYVARSGRVFIGTETVEVTQRGRLTSALAFAISPEETTGAVEGANAVIGVMATPDLPWTATSQSNWLTVMGETAQGSGNGNVVYSISPNPTLSARTGTLRVTPAAASGLSAKTHTVNQPAATAFISASEYSFDAAGESYDVEVSTGSVVGWTISEDCDWISVDGTASRTGPGMVHISAAANPSVDGREATITIAGHVFKVVQPGRAVSVDYETQVYGTEGTGGDVEIHPDGGVSWKAVVSDPTWISLWGDENCGWDDEYNVVGTGDATLSFYLTDYTGNGLPRTCTITIGDQVIYITQRAYEAYVDPIADEVSGNAGEGEVGVSADLNAVWEAIATEPWITVVTKDGNGSGTVRYAFTENDTGKTRTGKIIIAGEEYTLTQAARQRVTITTAIAVDGDAGEIAAGTVTGGGVYGLGETVTLTAMPVDGYEFVGWSRSDAVSEASSPWTFRADVAKTVTANFRKIATYRVNGENVRSGTSRVFTAPAPVVYGGTTQVVCRGTSAFPDKGTNFTVVVTGDIAFTWDLWTTNYWVEVVQSEGGTVAATTGGGADGVRALPGWVETGDTIEATATPDAGKSFYRWRGVDGGSPHLVTPVSGPLTVSAIFGIFTDTLEEALDAPSLVFTTGGDANWVPVVDASAQTGLSSAASGAIGPECETWMDTTISGFGTLSFRWCVDCEHDPGGGVTWDRATVFTNGVEAVRMDGTTGWQTVTLPLSAATTTVRWSFYRDDHDEDNATFANRAWVDGVTVEGKEGK